MRKTDCTSLVQYSVDTEDSPPINLPHRRVPFVKREMQCMVDEIVAIVVTPCSLSSVSITT